MAPSQGGFCCHRPGPALRVVWNRGGTRQDVLQQEVLSAVAHLQTRGEILLLGSNLWKHVVIPAESVMRPLEM